MSELKICRICLRTEAKVYKFDRYQLKCYYEEVIALKVLVNDGIPQYFCYECAMVLYKFHKFKEKCYIGLKAFKEMLWKGSISYESVYKHDRSKNLQSSLSISKQYAFDEDGIDTEDYRIHLLDNDSEQSTDQNTASELINDSEFNAEATSVNSSNIDKIYEDTPKSKKEILANTKRHLNPDHWKTHNFSEEEAVKEFRARANDKKYLTAAFKCTDCFKGFSKRDMLTRHLHKRHDEAIGSYECRFCHTRFKWNCHLRRHIGQHFTKYECLRCHLICPLESALLHEENHSGANKRCTYCDQQFRHYSTYYTHLRSHRSAHVCPRCGAALVSRAGLRQHRRLAHALDPPDSADDDDDVNTHCDRCKITFETRKAYDEHLFQSTMHADVAETVQQEQTIPKKVLGKRERDKIKKQLRKRISENTDVAPLPTVTRKKKRFKRKHKKPTTCHQCGEHFATQAACMRHHIATHPRTSFFASSDRYMCDICGASLAPSSVAMHQNMHSREKTFTCDTCGRPFHTQMGLKRHLVTHTGEKPYACGVCDKRFTQSNSMKLHHRTAHLHQPYPKRNRSKKKNESQETVAEESSATEESSAGGAPAPDIPLSAPDALVSDDNMHYLTLN